jgi:hypothetical protein
MSDTYIVRLFVADPATAPGPAGPSPLDGRLHGTVVRVSTGRQLPFRDDTELVAAVRRLGDVEGPERRADPPT